MSFIDKAIMTISPEWALKREAARAKITALNAAVDSIRSYDAASRGRRTEGWRTGPGSHNAEVWGALNLIRDRSRDLARNNPWAVKAVSVIVNNTVGMGIQATPVGASARAAKKYKEMWKAWAGKTDCDIEGRKTAYGIMRLGVKTMCESGEVLIIRRRRATPDRIPYQIQVLEPDFLDHTKNLPPDADGVFTFMGVEMDNNGKRLNYWIYDRHPGDVFRTGAISRRIPADDVIHLFEELRPGQVRGVPAGVSAMIRLKDLDDYEAAQLVRQKLAACFSVFVVDVNGTVGKRNAHPPIDKLEPGMIEILDSGYDVRFATPPGAEGYGDYVKHVIRAIAAGFEVTYESIAGDLSDVNFSSGRMGWLEQHRRFSMLQQHTLIPVMCDRMWNWFLEGAAIISPTVRYTEVRWTPPRREMIDPVNEVKGLSEEVRNGFASWEDVARRLGQDPDILMEQLVENNKLFEANGLMLACDPRYDTNRTNGPAAGSDPANPDASQEVPQ